MIKSFSKITSQEEQLFSDKYNHATAGINHTHLRLYSSNTNIYIHLSEIWCTCESSGTSHSEISALIKLYSGKPVKIVLSSSYQKTWVDLFLVLPFHIETNTEFKHLINERHNLITVLSWQSKEQPQFVPDWKDSQVTKLKKTTQPTRRNIVHPRKVHSSSLT